MSTLKEMSAEYLEAAARLAMSIQSHKKAGDLPPEELAKMRSALRDLRSVAHLLSGYYDVPRSGIGAAVGWKARSIQDDHY